VTVRLVAHCRRRYRRACRCPVLATVMAPGPPKAIGKGLVSNGFIAMLLTERYVAGRSLNSLIAGLARQGAGDAGRDLRGRSPRTRRAAQDAAAAPVDARGRAGRPPPRTPARTVSFRPVRLVLPGTAGPFVLTGEQIDGAFSFDTDDYLLEARWRRQLATPRT
jgi:hypothetical protein